MDSGIQRMNLERRKAMEKAMKTKNRDRARFVYKPRELREPRKARSIQSRGPRDPTTRPASKPALLLDGLVEQIKHGSSLAQLYARLLAATLLDEEEARRANPRRERAS